MRIRACILVVVDFTISRGGRGLMGRNSSIDQVDVNFHYQEHKVCIWWEFQPAEFSPTLG